MHNAVIKYISFDERVFPNGPVLLDDGIYSHMLVPDDQDFLPVVNDLDGGEYTLFVSASEKCGEVALEFTLFSDDCSMVRREKVLLNGFRLKLPLFAGREELEEYRNSAYAIVLEKNLGGWLAEPDLYFFETLAMFTRTAIEDTFGDLMTSARGEADRMAVYTNHQTIH